MSVPYILANSNVDVDGLEVLATALLLMLSLDVFVSAVST